MGRSLQSRLQQSQRADALGAKRSREAAEITERRLEAARQYKKARRPLSDRIDELELRASAHRLEQMLATEERNQHNQTTTHQPIQCNTDEARFFAEIDKPLSKTCAVCGELTSLDSIKTIEYAESDSRFQLLSITTATGVERGLIDAGIARNGSKELVTVCARCLQSLNKKQVPRFSVASGFKITPVPKCLAELNPMEARMIGIGVCFTTCYTLGALGQSATRGNSINFWNSAYDIVTTLPRPTSRCGVIRMKPAGSSGSSPYYHVRPWLLREALSWLIANNPIYRSVHIDNELLETMSSDPDIPTVEFEQGDDELESKTADCDDMDEFADNDQFDESFVLEHARETQRETDIMLELLQGHQEEQAYVASRHDHPMNEYTTKLLMQSCFPTLFPHGLGGFHPIEGHERRSHEFKLADYCNHLMAWHDRRFVTHPSFKFFCLNLIQRRQIDGLLKQVHHSGAAASVHTTAGEEETVGECADQPQQSRQNVSAYLRDLRPFFRSVRGTGLYWANVRDDVMAMLGDPALDSPWPTFFVTLSAADTIWPDFFRVCDPTLSLEDAAALSPKQRRQFLNQNPDLAARHFHRRFQAFFKHILRGQTKPLGEIVDFFWRIEFQRRGSPHVHALFWAKDSPDILELSKSDEGITQLSAFADKFVSCWRGHRADGQSKPAIDPLCLRPPPATHTEEREKDLVELVERVQLHVCSSRSSCQRNGDCRFGFPKDVRDHTEVVRDVQKGTVRIRFEHKRDDTNTNNYNPTMLQSWRANMDVKIIGNAYGAAEYTAAYISKAEPDSVRFRKTIEKALSKLPNGVPYERVLKRNANAVLAIREVSAQEAVYILSSNLCLYGKSRTVLKVKVSRHDRRFYRVETDRLDGPVLHVPSSTGVRIEPLENAYMLRPRTQQFNELSYREFCQTYEISASIPNSNQRLPRWVLLDGRTHIKARRQKQVVRPSPRYRTDEENADYCYAQLLFHKPWRQLSEISLDDDEVCSEYFRWKSQETLPWVRHLHDSIVREQMLQVSRDDGITLPAPNWTVALGNDWMGELQCTPVAGNALTSTYKPKFEYTADDVARARSFLKNVVKPFTKSCGLNDANAENVLPILYATSDQSPSMTDDQWKPYSIWMRQSRRRFRATPTTPCEPVRMIVSGEGGTGKSWLIKQIIQDLRVVFGRYDVSTRVLLMAHQGSAAYLIGGRTLTSALGLPTQSAAFRQDYIPLSTTKPGQTTLQRLQEEYERIHMLVVDEFGVISCGMLQWINRRLQEIFVSDLPFGGRDILFTGDPGQLGPVKACSLSTPAAGLTSSSDEKGRELWVNIDLYFVLRQQNRGSADPEWYDTLRRVRVGNASQTDLQLINSRVDRVPASRVRHLVYLAYRNVDVDQANDDAIRLMERPMCCIPAHHDVQVRQQCASTTQLDAQTREALLIEARAMTTPSSQFLSIELKLCESVPVILTYNMEQRAGLCNGSKGEVYDIIPDDGTPAHLPIILVKMRDYKGPSFLATVPQVVPITSRTVALTTPKDGPYRLTRTALPLHLGFATTIHKIQGQTCTQAFVLTQPV